MAVYTCDACLYTFSAENFPERCPDCGKETVARRLSVDGRTIIRSYPAVRPATETEIVQYEAVQAEIAEEEAAANKSESRISDLKGMVEKLDQYQMTLDERNFALVLWFELHESPTEYLIPTLEQALRGDDSARVVRFYQDMRRTFTSKIGDDRWALQRAGLSEPFFISDSDWEADGEDSDEKDGSQSESGWYRPVRPKRAGPALQTLYRFRPDSDVFLPNKTPNLGNLRRIDLKKIAEEPSAEFLRFLADWRNSLVS